MLMTDQVFTIGVPQGVGPTFGDLYGFPRRIPEGVDVIECFPLVPVPEGIFHIRADLLGQLAMATGCRRTACLLMTEDRAYSGYSTADVEDPFTMALDEALSDINFIGAIVTGEGDIKEKHTLPLFGSWDRLKGLLLPGSKIIVVQPNNRDLCRVIPAHRMQAAYEPKTPLEFQGETIEQIFREALENTSLSIEDCEFIVRLRLDALKNDISYNLTGSAVGDSGPSNALRPGRYSDLDVIAESKRPIDEIVAHFEKIAEAHYGSLLKVPKVVKISGSQETVMGYIYSYPDGTPIFDFYPTNLLSNAFVRPEYYQRKFFIKLS